VYRAVAHRVSAQFPISCWAAIYLDVLVMLASLVLLLVVLAFKSATRRRGANGVDARALLVTEICMGCDTNPFAAGVCIKQITIAQ